MAYFLVDDNDIYLSDCPSVLPLPNHTYVDVEFAPYGSTVTYRCDLGWEIAGTNPRPCYTQGRYLTQAPSCARKYKQLQFQCVCH